MADRTPVPTESREQQTLFAWARLHEGKYPALALMYHIPNGGSRRSGEAGRLRAEGVKAGVPDVCLPVARGAYHGLYIELKRVSGGRVAEAQREWVRALTEEGYMAAVCRGFDAATELVLWYLGLGRG